MKAERMGVYFDGVARGRDCSCCGDRWDSPSVINLENKSKSYKIEFANIEEYAQHLADKYAFETFPKLS